MMMKMGRQPRARFHFEKAMEDFPRSPRPDLKMGNYYLQLNRPDDARASFRKSIEKDPNYVEGYNNLAVMAMKEKKWDEAGKMLEEIVKIQPDYANAYLNRGIIASDIEKNKPKALENFKHYVELNGPRTAQVQRWIKELEAQ
jgi:tetratricopeptide (TPR) repeat protein